MEYRTHFSRLNINEIYLLHCLSCFRLGDNKEQSLKIFEGWLDTLFDESGLPCYCKVLNANGSVASGLYHHLTGEQADNFLRLVLDRLEEWAMVCATKKLTCGTVILAYVTDKGTSFFPQNIGPFQC